MVSQDGGSTCEARFQYPKTQQMDGSSFSPDGHEVQANPSEAYHLLGDLSHSIPIVITIYSDLSA